MIKPRLRSVARFRLRRLQPKRDLPPLPPEKPLTEVEEEYLDTDSSDSSDSSNESPIHSEEDSPLANLPERYYPPKRPSKKLHTRLKEACLTRPRDQPGFELRRNRIAAVKKRLKEAGSGNVSLKLAKAVVEAAKMKIPEVKADLSETKLSRGAVERGDLMQMRRERKSWWMVDNAGYLDERRARLGEQIRSRRAEEKARVARDRAAAEGSAGNAGEVIVPEIVVTEAEEPAAVTPYRPSYADNENAEAYLCLRRRFILQTLFLDDKPEYRPVLARVTDDYGARLAPDQRSESPRTRSAWARGA